MNIASGLLVGIMKALVGAHPRWQGCEPSSMQRIYFANHTSHIDTLAIWSALPAEARATTRPVAAKDYWNKGPLRRYVALSGLNAVLIERAREDRTIDPLQPLIEALEQGYSLIIFPEGTRGNEALPGPFKSGLFRLMQRFPRAELIPVYLENLNRAMPKGSLLPIPLICSVRFGSPLQVVADEIKEAFLDRARSAIVSLA
ncbi:MAG: lysophospholipid acyltransferase family protein [Steroidobacteraceae bacterium]|jgi:1-acyl-sn-glycerol-3-phosphate acyltransferase